MTAGAAVNRLARPVVGHEAVLFRTHSEILTDQRMIIRGSSYPLLGIDRVYIRPAWHFAPYALLRLALIGAAALLILSFAGVIQPGHVPGSRALHLIGGVLIGLLVVLATRLVPQYTLWLKTQSGDKQVVMRSPSVRHLRAWRDEIETAVARRKSVSAARPTSDYAAPSLLIEP